MPPAKRQKPEFSLTGRYLIDVAFRKENPVFHDTQNFKDECKIGEMATANQSRFNNLGWALQRGYVRCENCFTN